jgi:hypothetical protein
MSSLKIPGEIVLALKSKPSLSSRKPDSSQPKSSQSKSFKGKGSSSALRSMYDKAENASCSESSSSEEEITESDILAMEHFPARVVAFYGNQRGRKELYGLEFEDGVERKIDRGWFLAEGEKGWGQCAVR